jgi:hypothetical protein
MAVDPLQNTFPAGQATQRVSAVALHMTLYVPAAHTTAPHAAHADAPLALANVPGPQATGDVKPACGHALPTGQMEHSASVVSEHPVEM